MTFSFRKTGYWTAGILVVLLAAAPVVLSFVNWNQYRDALSQVASDQVGMRVELAGNVSLKLYPRPTLSAAMVRISPAGEGFQDVVATADFISMRLGYGELLKGKVALHSLAFEGLTAAIDEDASGNWRVRGWPETETSEEENTLARVEISNSSFEVKPFEGSLRHVKVVSLKLTGALSAGAVNWDGSLLWDGLALQLTGRLKPIVLRDELSVKVGVRLEETQIDISGRLTKSGNMTGRLVVSGPKLGQAAKNLSTVLGREPFEAAMPDLAFALDMQVDRKGDIFGLVTRQLQIGDTLGRADLTVAMNANQPHVAGTVSFGVVDLKVWQEALPVKKASSVIPSAAAANRSVEVPSFGGTLDVTIEGVRMQGGVGQRIDAVLAFRPEGIALTSLQALLPGGASVTLQGELQQQAGHAAVSIDIGNVAALGRWAGVEVPASVSEGRLATASARANFRYKGADWTLENLEGHVDTSNVKGELSGSFSDFLPRQLLLIVDGFNIDSYLTKATMTEGAAGKWRLPEGYELAFDITSERLRGFGADLGKARFVGALGDGRLNVEYISIESGESKLTAKGDLANDADDIALALTVDFNAWHLPVTEHFVPGLQRYLIAADMQQLDGNASAAGHLSKMRLGFDAAAQGQKLAISGELGFPEGRLTFVDMQGSLTHKNIAPLVRLANWADVRELPAQVTFSMTKVAAGQPLVVKAGGDVAGGKIQATLTNLEKIQAVEFTFDHTNVAGLAALTGVPLNMLDQTKGLRADVAWRATDGGWALTIPKLNNGARALSGELSVTEDGVFAGSFDLTGFDAAIGVGVSKKQNEADMTALWREAAEALRPYAGELSLRLQNSNFSGQAVTAPNVRLNLGDQSARVVLGSNAEINGAAAEMVVDFDLTGAMPFTGKATIAALDFERMLAAEGFAGIVVTTLAADITLSGEVAAAEGLAHSLKGSGTLEGGAGQLRFLSALALVEAAQTAGTRKNFLSSVGGLLRRGETPLDGLTVRFVLDGGVMLVEHAEAIGSWGKLALDGQINFADDFLSMKGALALSHPVDTPEIPVRYQGSLRNPASKWTGKLFERFVIAGIERRLRASLFKDLVTRENADGATADTPALAVFSHAFGLIEALKKTRAKKKRLADEARRKKAALATAAELEAKK